MPGSGNANGLNTAYYTQFNTENRYYNFAINLATAGGAGNTTFVSTYGALTFAQTVAAAYETIVGTANVGTAAANAAIASIISDQSFFTAVAQQRAGGIDAGGAVGQNIALKAIAIGYILEEANKADVGTYAKAIDQLEASVAAQSARALCITNPFSTNIVSTFSTGGTGLQHGLRGAGRERATTQTNFSLTTGIDTFRASPPAASSSSAWSTTRRRAPAARPSSTPPPCRRATRSARTGANNTLTVDHHRRRRRRRGRQRGGRQRRSSDHQRPCRRSTAAAVADPISGHVRSPAPR